MREQPDCGEFSCLAMQIPQVERLVDTHHWGKFDCISNSMSMLAGDLCACTTGFHVFVVGTTGSVCRSRCGRTPVAAAVTGVRCAHWHAQHPIWCLFNARWSSGLNEHWTISRSILQPPEWLVINRSTFFTTPVMIDCIKRIGVMSSQ